MCILSFKIIYQTIFQSRSTILHSPQQHMRDPVSLHPCQHLVSSLFFSWAILIVCNILVQSYFAFPPWLMTLNIFLCFSFGQPSGMQDLSSWHSLPLQWKPRFLSTGSPPGNYQYTIFQLCRMNKFWRSSAQHGDYLILYCKLKFAKRVNLNCSHRKKMIIMWSNMLINLIMIIIS